MSARLHALRRQDEGKAGGRTPFFWSLCLWSLLGSLLSRTLGGLSFLTTDHGRLGIGFFLKLLDTTRGVDKLLFAGVKRVAFGAQFYVNLGKCRTGDKFIATSTDDFGVGVVGWMDVRFHNVREISRNNEQKQVAPLTTRSTGE